jgi:hypothetical protein
VNAAAANVALILKESVSILESSKFLFRFKVEGLSKPLPTKSTYIYQIYHETDDHQIGQFELNCCLKVVHYFEFFSITV